MTVLENLQPKKVFHFFEELTKIPHGSGNEKEISNYLVNFAKKRNLEVLQDDALNVIIKKAGTSGYENSSTVIIQGHMDMVCEKGKTSNHDFLKDPLKLRIDGDNIYATDTTLGADDGIAIAYALAILDSSDIAHPPIELLVTTSEETGMDGAIALDTSSLKGKILLNIDSEEEGIFLVSCAGGVDTLAKLKNSWEPVTGKACKLEIHNLNGGHSGMEIIKQRANANKLMGRLLYSLNEEIGINIASINGGTKHNAIPRECEAIITFDKKNIDKVKEHCIKMENIFKNEFKIEDPGIQIVLHERVDVKEQLTNHCTNNLISFTFIAPNGIQTMSKEIDGLVESSLNLGIIRTYDKETHFSFGVRSSVSTLKYEITDRLQALATLVNGSIINERPYPAWQYESKSPIRDLCVKTYEELYGNKPEISAIHAGLECGLLKEKMSNTDMISFGPNIFGAHTPQEHLSISSTEKVWNFLLYLLKNIK